MAYVIDIDVFKKWAVTIAELANALFRTSIYYPEHVEVHTVLVDYDDGLGYRLLSRAMIRNPKDSIYEYVTDILGPPELALQELEQTLTKEIKQNNINYISKMFKLN